MNACNPTGSQWSNYGWADAHKVVAKASARDATITVEALPSSEAKIKNGGWFRVYNRLADHNL